MADRSRTRRKVAVFAQWRSVVDDRHRSDLVQRARDVAWQRRRG